MLLWIKFEVEGKTVKMGWRELKALHIIFSLNGATFSQIWARIWLRSSNLKRVMERLQEKGFVYEHNGKYYLTEFGKKVYFKGLKVFKSRGVDIAREKVV